MIRILDLFAGTQSVKKALNDLNVDFEYKGIDIFSPEGENLILDLSKKNVLPKIAKLLGNWKPNFVWASPPCYAFSRATCINNGTLAFEIDKNKMPKLRKNFKEIQHSQYIKFKNDPKWQKAQIQKGIDGLQFIDNTMEIIKFYKANFIIENPASAISKYIYIYI